MFILMSASIISLNPFDYIIQIPTEIRTLHVLPLVYNVVPAML